jgi:hypothetical protein
MRTIGLAYILLSVCLITGCTFYGADEGSIRGVVYYSDDKAIVPNPWVAIYESATPDVIYLLVQGDELGRYSAYVPAGDYIALGSTSESGPFTGVDTAFNVMDTVTTVKRITITEESP